MKFKLPDKKQLIVYSTFILIGIIGGYLYWRFVGCQTGSCPLKSNPYYTIAVGGLFGYLIPDMFYERKKKQENVNHT